MTRAATLELYQGDVHRFMLASQANQPSPSSCSSHGCGEQRHSHAFRNSPAPVNGEFGDLHAATYPGKAAVDTIECCMTDA